ncbi:hypothetical protein [Massilia sp. Leaf139]|uniref:hypothetical protein n=1 Tax=Massilia sp. Leaf139 TaxID=1736272 RepID=UPI0006F36C01|nr:hypothetical protein [Massilia sp. Leaf139]KQQ97373.1 hypothetical protein ASF77_05340 [Massilia sp. Leaf139]
MDRRTDYKTALLIDAAIKTPAPASPARVMAGMGVPFETARRVLTRPDERRHPLPAPEFKREAG